MTNSTRVLRHRKEVESEDSMYQVDISMSLFGILVIVLLTTTLSASLNDGQNQTVYLPKDQVTDNFPLRSACNTYVFKEVWLSRFGQLYKLDFTQIAQLYLADKATTQNPLKFKDYDGSLTIKKIAGAPPTSFSMRLKWSTQAKSAANLPQILVDTQLTITELLNDFSQNAEGAISKFNAPLLLFIWPEEHADTIALAQSFQNAGVKVEVNFVQGGILWYNRHPGLFSKKTIFRC